MHLPAQPHLHNNSLWILANSFGKQVPPDIPVTQKIPAVYLSGGILVGGFLIGNTISMKPNRDTSSLRHTMGGTEHTLVCLQVLVLPGSHIGQLLHSGSASLNDVLHHLMWQQDWVLNIFHLVLLGVCDGNGDQVRQWCSATFMHKSPEVPGTVLQCLPRIPNPSNTLDTLSTCSHGQSCILLGLCG